MRAVADVIDAHAGAMPESVAFLGDDETLSWSAYAERSDRLAARLAGLGLERGDRVGVMLPDGPGVHVAFVACEKAGLVVMGIGPRAGAEELRHLLRKSGASALIAPAEHRGLDWKQIVGGLRSEGVPLRHLLLTEGALHGDDPLLRDAPAPDPSLRARRLEVDELFLLNSTSGTTGLPKCVTHHQRRWMAFHELAVESGEMDEDDVFLSALPAPFGFGLWTAHFTPTLLGCPTVLQSQWSAERALEAIERHRVTVLAAVSTQFIMMLNEPSLGERDLSSLRALYTGGEAVPYERAAEFEERTGASVLQFYGSNETGALSRTTTRDSREIRLRSAGHVIPSMNVRLFDDALRDVTDSGEGQPGCRGALVSHGYWDDDEANARLRTQDGWTLTGDVARIDEDGVLTVIGRVADFIIRGGKNISGPAVEEAVATHPAVALAAAVAMPDPVYGERVCCYVELRDGESELTLSALTEHLKARGVSKDWLPERLIVVEALPRASGGKVAKGELRADLRRRLESEGAGG